MADVMSRIILQAQGGDQVAREVGKVTKAYKEAGTASKGMSATAGAAGADPFTKATSPGGIDDVDNRQENNRRRRQDAQQRLTGATGQGLQRGFGAAGTVAAGDPISGGAQGLGMLAGAGVVGLVAGAIAALGMGIQKLSNVESERMMQLSHGLRQAISGAADWPTFRQQIEEVQTVGAFPEEALLPYLQGLKAQGGRYNVGLGAGIGGAILNEGMDPATMAQWQVVRQRAGTGELFAGRMETDLMRGELAFGQAGQNRFIAAVSTAIEGAMTRGIERGGPSFQDEATYTNFTRLLSALAIEGLTDLGAIQAFQQIQGAVAGAANLGDPMNAAMFMAMRIPGESYGDTMRRMTEPGAEQDMFQIMKAQAGGDPERLEIMFQDYFKTTWAATPKAIKAMESQALYTKGIFTRYVPGQNVADTDDEVRRAIQADATARYLAEGTQAAARTARSAIIESVAYIQGGLTENTTARLYGAASGIFNANVLSPYRQMTGNWRAASRRGERDPEYTYPGAMPWIPEGLEALPRLFGISEAGKQTLPQLMMYGQYLTGKGTWDPTERAEMEKIAPIFDEVIRLLSLTSVQEYLSREGVLDTYAAAVETVNVGRELESKEHIIHISELLEGLVRTLGLDSYSDQGSTQ